MLLLAMMDLPPVSLVIARGLNVWPCRSTYPPPVWLWQCCCTRLLLPH